MNIVYFLLVVLYPKLRRQSVILSEDFKLFDSVVELEWNDTSDILSEVSLRNSLQEKGLRYKMTKTDYELVNEDMLPLKPILSFGPFELYPPCAATPNEQCGFNATSNNGARRNEKRKAKDKVKLLQKQFKPLQSLWLSKYGYKRFVGDWFYADQLSSDTPESSGGFNMKKGGYYLDGSYEPPD